MSRRESFGIHDQGRDRNFEHDNASIPLARHNLGIGEIEIEREACAREIEVM